MFSFNHSGGGRIVAKLQRIAQAATDAPRRVASEQNRRHAEAMRRRTFPRDTGRMERAFKRPDGPDRAHKATARGVLITLSVPYAQYQMKRVSPPVTLSSAERAHVFLEPIRLEFERAWRTG